jgi:hypothetical protein
MKNNIKYTREELLNALRGDSIAYVKFTKTNGETRHMRCTRNPKYIPESPTSVKTENKEKVIKENLDVINAFDVEKKGWRSFRVDSVTEYGMDNTINV